MPLVADRRSMRPFGATAPGKSNESEQGKLPGGGATAGKPGKEPHQEEMPPSCEDSNTYWSYIQPNLDSAENPPAEGNRSPGTPGSCGEEANDHDHPSHRNPEEDQRQPEPEPRWQAATAQQGTDIIAGANITNFRNFLAVAEEIQRTAIAIQKHGISAQPQGAAKAVACKHGFELIVGPQDEAGHAGVGVMVRRPGRAQEIPCISEEGHQAKQQGRLIIARVDTARGLEMITSSAYCWNGTT